MGVDTIAQELDRLYQFDMDKYISECNKWKKLGYKIYRNSEGKHKVVQSERVTQQRRNDTKRKIFGDDLTSVFGDIFGGMF